MDTLLPIGVPCGPVQDIWATRSDPQIAHRGMLERLRHPDHPEPSPLLGPRLPVVLSRAERQLYGCLLWARSGLPKGLRRRRVLFALRTNNPALMEPRLFGVELVYVDYSHPPEALVSLINAKQLNILAGPPSLLRLLAQQREAIAHPIDCLISYAEVLDDSWRHARRRTSSLRSGRRRASPTRGRDIFSLPSM